MLFKLQITVSRLCQNFRGEVVIDKASPPPSRCSLVIVTFTKDSDLDSDLSLPTLLLLPHSSHLIHNFIQRRISSPHCVRSNMGSVVIPHLVTAWHVDQAILSEDERLVVIRFGRDWDPDCMRQDEVLYKIADRKPSCFPRWFEIAH